MPGPIAWMVQDYYYLAYFYLKILIIHLLAIDMNAVIVYLQIVF